MAKEPKKQPISDETRNAILVVAWDLIAERGSLDVTQSEIARAAGVSRQTVYLAFGGRAGLLIAMTHNRDARSPEVGRLRAVRLGNGADWDALAAYTDAWLDYLPQIYPVALLLDAAAVSDPVAAAAWSDRMHGALRAGYRAICGRIDDAGRLAPGMSAQTAGDSAWSLVHLTAWRQLVVESGWSPQDFRASRKALMRAHVMRDESP